MFFHKMK